MLDSGIKVSERQVRLNVNLLHLGLTKNLGNGLILTGIQSQRVVKPERTNQPTNVDWLVGWLFWA